MHERQYILGKTQQGSPLSLGLAGRRQHIYIAGKSGTGKSSLLFNLAHTDLTAGGGFLFVDPHGDTAQALADSVPRERTQDVIYFDPLDSHVVGFNPLMRVAPVHRGTLAARIVEVFRNIWSDSWGPRLDFILTNAVRLLLENRGVTLIDIPRLLTDHRFRGRLLDKCEDPFVKAYWVNEYDRYTDKLRAEAIAPVQNKIGQFANNPILRHIVGTKSTIDIAKIMNEGKVLICNLSKRMGEEPSRLLGALLATSFAQVAESRAAIPETERKDFALYIDEFQNFATDSFATVLSESRKYRLSLVTANQFLGQVPELLRYAIIGNVGTLVIFRIGSFDAPVLSNELDVPEQALINQANFTARIKLVSNNNSPTEGMFIETLPPSPLNRGRMGAVLAYTRARHARPRPGVG